MVSTRRDVFRVPSKTVVDPFQHGWNVDLAPVSTMWPNEQCQLGWGRRIMSSASKCVKWSALSWDRRKMHGSRDSGASRMMKTLSHETRGTNSDYMAICYSDAPSLPCSGNQKENKYNALILMPGGDIGMIDVMLVLARGMNNGRARLISVFLLNRKKWQE